MPRRPFDLRRRDADAAAVFQRLVGRHRLAVYADEVVCRLAVGQLLGEELADGRAIRHFDTVGEAGTDVVDEVDLHRESPRVKAKTDAAAAPCHGCEGSLELARNRQSSAAG